MNNLKVNGNKIKDLFIGTKSGYKKVDVIDAFVVEDEFYFTYHDIYDNGEIDDTYSIGHVTTGLHTKLINNIQNSEYSIEKAIGSVKNNIGSLKNITKYPAINLIEGLTASKHNLKFSRSNSLLALISTLKKIGLLEIEIKEYLWDIGCYE